MNRRPSPALNTLLPEYDEASPRLADGEALHRTSPHGLPETAFSERFWGNATPPTRRELAWIRSFGRYAAFDPQQGKLSKRLTVDIADLRQATRIIVYHHYLHRGRTMAQLPYWVCVDGVPVGVVLYSLPRLSVPVDGVGPMNLLELARIWISPDVQNRTVMDSANQQHSFAVASAGVGRTLRVVRQDWFLKYPHLPDAHAVVSWADTEHHEGTIYRAANFRETGQSGGSMHGSRQRPNGGRDQLNADYSHPKTRFLYRFRRALTMREKERLQGGQRRVPQLSLFDDV